MTELSGKEGRKNNCASIRDYFLSSIVSCFLHLSLFRSSSLALSCWQFTKSTECASEWINAIQAHLYFEQINYDLLLISDTSDICVMCGRNSRKVVSCSPLLFLLSLISPPHSPLWQHSTPFWVVHLTGQGRTGEGCKEGGALQVKRVAILFSRRRGLVRHSHQ